MTSASSGLPAFIRVGLKLTISVQMSAYYTEKLIIRLMPHLLPASNSVQIIQLFRQLETGL